MNKVHFSSNTPEWETPWELFLELDGEFHFTLDPCATKDNAKCEVFYTQEDDGLSLPWFGNVFCNPPYGRVISSWVVKAVREVGENPDVECVVLLLPARTDTKWFHQHIYHKHEVRFMQGRVRFGEEKAGAPFPSMIVVVRKGEAA